MAAGFFILKSGNGFLIEYFHSVIFWGYKTIRLKRLKDDLHVEILTEVNLSCLLVFDNFVF